MKYHCYWHGEVEECEHLKRAPAVSMAQRLEDLKTSLKEQLKPSEPELKPISYCCEPECFVEAALGEMWCFSHLPPALSLRPPWMYR